MTLDSFRDNYPYLSCCTNCCGNFHANRKASPIFLLGAPVIESTVPWVISAISFTNCMISFFYGLLLLGGLRSRRWNGGYHRNRKLPRLYDQVSWDLHHHLININYAFFHVLWDYFWTCFPETNGHQHSDFYYLFFKNFSFIYFLLIFQLLFVILFFCHYKLRFDLVLLRFLLFKWPP